MISISILSPTQLSPKALFFCIIPSPLGFFFPPYKPCVSGFLSLLFSFLCLQCKVMGLCITLPSNSDSLSRNSESNTGTELVQTLTLTHIYTASTQEVRAAFHSASSTFWLLDYEVSTLVHLELPCVLPSVLSGEALDFFSVRGA